MSTGTTPTAVRVPRHASRSLALRFDAAGRPDSLDEATRSVGVIAATEAPAFVFDWERWDVVEEVLLMKGCRLPASGRAPLLDSHSRFSVGSVLGSFREMSVAGGELPGRCFFSSAADVEPSWQKVREGHVTDVSIGYEINAYVWIEDGKTAVVEGRKFKGPLRVVTDWSLKELSLCPIGADENAKVRQKAAAAKTRPEAGRNEHEETDMPTKKRKARKRSAGGYYGEVLRLRAELAEMRALHARAKQREAEEDDKECDDQALLEDDEDTGADSGREASAEDDEERGDEQDDEERDDAEDDKERKGKRSAPSASAVVRRERARISEIRGICASFGIREEQEEKYIREGATVDAVRKDVLAVLQARNTGGPGISAGAGRGAVQGSRLVADAERRAAK